jgi:hypothetical protein
MGRCHRTGSIPAPLLTLSLLISAGVVLVLLWVVKCSLACALSLSAMSGEAYVP